MRSPRWIGAIALIPVQLLAAAVVILSAAGQYGNRDEWISIGN